MKVNIAVVRLVLRTNKVLADGTSPIMLRCSFGGMKEVSTHFSCKPSDWDKRGECVRRSCIGYKGINAAIAKLKAEAIARRDEFERLGVSYNPNMVLKPSDRDNTINVGTLEGLVGQYIDDRGLAPKTITTWKDFLKVMDRYKGKDMLVTSIDLAYVKGLVSWMEGNGFKDGVIRMTCAKVAAITRYAIGKKLMKQEDYPFLAWSYQKKYKPSSRMQYLHPRTVDFMKDAMLGMICNVDGTRWSYKDEGARVLEDKKVRCGYLYLMGILFQGLSPCDLMMVRTSDIVTKSISGMDFYCLDTHRAKTHKSVKVMIPRHRIYEEAMMGLSLLFHDKDSWLLPCLNDNDYGLDKEELKVKIRGKLCMFRDGLREWFEFINSLIVKHNMENDDDIPLIDVTCPWYSYRHTYAMYYLWKPNSTPLGLATLLGRSVNSLSQYIKDLERDEDIAEAVIGTLT